MGRRSGSFGGAGGYQRAKKKAKLMTNVGNSTSPMKSSQPSSQTLDINDLIKKIRAINPELHQHNGQIATLTKKLREAHGMFKEWNFSELKNIVQEALDTGIDRMDRGLNPEISSDKEEMSTSDEDEDDSSTTRKPTVAVALQTPPSQKSVLRPTTPGNGMMNDLIMDTYKKFAIKTAQTTTPGSDSSAPPTPSSAVSGSAQEASKVQDAENTERKGVKRSREELKSKVIEKLNEKKKQKSYVILNRPTVRYADMGGIEGVLQDVRELIEYPFTHPEIYTHLGVEPPRGILFHGPPGCGKTMLAEAIAGEIGVPFLKISAPEVVSGMSGESEAKLRSLFKDAVDNAPSLVFIDEIDAITPKRETASREMEKRIVAQLLTCMDELNFEKTGGKMVMVIGATNRPDSLDEALRRAGRFDREISLGIPDDKARARILQVLTKKLKLEGDFDFLKIGKMTPGYVGADLMALTKEAAVIAINRIFGTIFGAAPTATTASTSISRSAKEEAALAQRMFVSERLKTITEPLSPEQLASLNITMDDFEKAVKKVQPSAKREGFATIPNVSWEDIGSLEEVRDELQTSIMDPIQFPEKYAELGLTAPAGVLLFGPPGCGKTLLAKAIANGSGANFISIKGPELLNKFVGESERAVRQVFARASASAPCVIFFDELDALCPKRGNDSSNASTERVVNQLLTEMDGLESRRSVFVIAATNRPDIIDPAMLRPGRLDKLVYVPLPGPESRTSILRTIGRKTPIEKSVDLSLVAKDKRCENFSGADLAALVREAAVNCMKRNKSSQGGLIVAAIDFEVAFTKVSPSVTAQDRRMYDRLAKKLQTARSHINNDSNTSGEGEKSNEGGMAIDQ